MVVLYPRRLLLLLASLWMQNLITHSTHLKTGLPLSSLIITFPENKRRKHPLIEHFSCGPPNLLKMAMTMYLGNLQMKCTVPLIEFSRVITHGRLLASAIKAHYLITHPNG